MNNQEIKFYKERWRQQNEPIGKMCGFPQCCIDEFCELPPEIMSIRRPTEIDVIKLEASKINGKFSGFIPCAHHAIQIMQKKISLQSLIHNRDRKLLPFPAQ
jgi:hypothetical protein